MIAKVLTPTTIIPSHLYVKRSADRQLRGVVENMGRPAYVLVSRQMGKTNLLINAKRELETPHCSFAYVDLSNRPPSAQVCFRTIIDTVLASRPQIFRGAKQEIQSSRSTSHPSAHAEHQSELLVILRHFPGRLVIVLDEIDTLANAEFSDEVFAQIRSVYFARINFTEFERLTYILSGVAEPSGLIKDKNKSPFNIGEKIYLDDFTKEEHDEFASRLPVASSAVIVDRVYYWANGHPRMTWDIWAELEEVFVERGVIGVSDVDEVIQKLYFSDAPIAPVDHIRELVRKDSVLLRALRELNDGHQPALPDEVRSKLYLAGVTAFAMGAKLPRVKNNVLKAALSNAWLQSVDQHKISLAAQGDERKRLGDFSAAIEYYSRALSYVENRSSKVANTIELAISECYINLGDLRKALEHLNVARFDAHHDPQDYFTTLFWTGLCHYGLDEFEQAYARFKEIVDEYRPSILRCKALLNCAGSLLSLSPVNNEEQVISMYRELLKETTAVHFDDLSELHHIRALAHYNIARLSQEAGRAEEAIQSYQSALDVGVPEYAPSILLDMSEVQEDESDRRSTLQQAAELIRQGKLKLRSSNAQGLIDGSRSLEFSVPVLSRILICLFETGDEALLDQLVAFSRKVYFHRVDTDEHLLVDLSDAAAALGKKSTEVQLLQTVLNRICSKEDTYERLITDTLRRLGVAKYNGHQPCVQELSEFLSRKEALWPKDPSITQEDIAAFVMLVGDCRRQGLLPQGIAIAEREERWLEMCDRQLRVDFSGIFYLHAHMTDAMGRLKEATAAARMALTLISENPPDSTTIFGANQLSVIDVQMRELIRRYVERTGRNNPCPCGSGDKFKKCCGRFI